MTSAPRQSGIALTIAAAVTIAGTVADAQVVVAPAPADTVAAPAPIPVPTFAPGYFDVIPKTLYLTRRSSSLDNYLEWVHSYMLVRAGPIGKDVAFSRWGIGRGRALALVDGVEFNDPQNGLAPLTHFAVAGLHELRLDNDDDSSLVLPQPIEGYLELAEVPAPDEQAHTSIELSKGDRSLRQRRVRFSSKRARIALDLGYDELLDDGYSFDATGTVGINVPDYGKSQTRHITMRVRGEFEDDARYEIGFRRYVGDSQGDLQDPFSEHRRSGHLATVKASVGRVDLTLFERGFDVSDPDSNTVNSTRAAYVTVHAVRLREANLLVKLGIEDIVSEQRVAGALANNGLRRFSASARGSGRVGSMFLRLQGGVDGYTRHTIGWGGGGDIGYQAGSHRFVLSVRRSYRLPSLGELYLPAHADGGFTIAGNSGVDAEHAWEATVGMSSRFGPVTNELRVGALRVGNPIAYLPVPVGAEIWRVATNGASESLGVLEDHMRVSDTVAGFNVILDGGIVWTAGDRDGFMRAAPEYRTSINARIGRDFFESTSSLYVTADYQYTAKRTGFQGDALSPYRVLNAYFELRLIDAYLYLGLMNALDESYQTAGGYLMTPRTFMYGIAWNLFD